MNFSPFWSEMMKKNKPKKEQQNTVDDDHAVINKFLHVLCRRYLSGKRYELYCLSPDEYFARRMEKYQKLFLELVEQYDEKN
jgi:hypothetical protein